LHRIVLDCVRDRGKPSWGGDLPQKGGDQRASVECRGRDKEGKKI